LILDSPLARGRIELYDSRLAGVVAAMHVPTSPADLHERFDLDGEESLDPLLSLLVAAGTLLAVDDDGLTDEDRSDAARCWEFADLVLHGRSRTSRTDLRVGGTYRFGREIDPSPPVKPPMGLTRIPLARPDLAALLQADVSFTRVLERRRSVRRHGDPPISVAQLGEFLYRVARVRARGDEHTRVEGAESDGYLTSFRVYPGGGARHPLEVYPVVGRCDGLEPGLYHYDPAQHELERLPQSSAVAERLLRTSSVPMEDGGVPQLILVLTSRFRRLSWKYEGNAYALLLQEVGVVYQTMYLVATAMGLAPCAIGGGDAADFAHLIGADPLEEASVGAFVLGSASAEAR
jgi:SagB-type dehydrogenase family enzyme